MENNKDEILDAMEDFDVLDEIEFEGATYFAMTPIEGKEAEGEVFIMKLVDIDGAEMLESVEDDELFDKVYNIFKENNADEFDFLD
ncbi:MAG: DUF1292 domain-containing protein [Clostridia bacterium]